MVKSFDPMVSFGTVLGSFIVCIHAAVEQGPKSANEVTDILLSSGASFPASGKAKSAKVATVRNALTMLKSVPEASSYLTSVKRRGICRPEHRTARSRSSVDDLLKSLRADRKDTKDPKVLAYLDSKISKLLTGT